MAFYPTEDYKVLVGSTVPEIEAKVRAAIADDYEVVADNILYTNEYVDDKNAYTQAVVKHTNTDDAYIAKQTASMLAAFKPFLDTMITHLESIDNKLTTMNTTLSTISSRVNTTNTKLDTVNTNLTSANTKLDEIVTNTTPATGA